MFPTRRRRVVSIAPNLHIPLENRLIVSRASVLAIPRFHGEAVVMSIRGSSEVFERHPRGTIPVPRHIDLPGTSVRSKSEIPKT